MAVRETVCAGDLETTTTCTSLSETEFSLVSDCSQRRKNTLQEKRRMRNVWKKRKREVIRQLKANESESALVSLQQRVVVAHEHLKLQKEKAEAETRKFRGMARTYFDRFCWEVEQRRDNEKGTIGLAQQISSIRVYQDKGSGGVFE